MALKKNENGLKKVKMLPETTSKYKRSGAKSAAPINNSELIPVKRVQSSVFDEPDREKTRSSEKTLYDLAKQRVSQAQAAAVRKTLPAFSQPVDPVRMAAMNMLGQKGKGNIDLYNRPQYRQPDGKVSTVNSISIGTDEGEVLIPTIGRDAKGRPVQWTDEEAIDNYYKTGQHLGKFRTPEEADRYADRLHRQQEAYYDRSDDEKLLSAAPHPYEVGQAVDNYKRTGVIRKATPEEMAAIQNPEKDFSSQGISSSEGKDIEILQGEPKNLTREGQWATRHPYAGTAMYGVANVVGGAEGFVNMAEAAVKAAAEGKKIDPNAIHAAPIAQAYRTGAAEGFRKGLENGVTKGIADAAGISSDDGRYSKGEQWMDFMTGVGADAVSSAMGMATGGNLSTIMMGANAANQSLYDTASDENTTSGQALALAAANGVAEAFFEHFSIENFEAMRITNPTSAGQYLKMALKSAGIEASEETFTEIANILSDIAIRGEHSELGNEYQSYIDQGDDANTAATRTMRSALRQIGLAGLGGFLSGGMHTGMVMGANTVQGGLQMQNDVRNGLSMEEIREGIDTSTPEGQRVYDLANEMTSRDNVGVMDYGYLNNAIDNAVETGMRNSEAEETAAPEETAEDDAESLEDLARRRAEDRETEFQSIREAAREGNVNIQEVMERPGLLNESEKAEAIRAGSGDSLIEELSQGYDAAGSAAFRENYRGGSINSYTRAFSQIYNSARAGMTRSDLGAYSSMLSKDQAEAAWKAGAEDGQKANEEIFKNLESYKDRQKNHTGGLNDELSYPGARNENGNLSRILDELGKKTGIVFAITDGEKYKNSMLGDSGASGGYRAGVIAVDVRSKNPLATVSHEMTHWLKEGSPFGYAFFRDTAVRSLLKNPDFDFEGTLEQYRKTYQGLTREQLIEEMVADSTGTFLNDEAFVQDVINGNRTVGQRVLDWLNAVCDAIRELISTKSLSKAAYALKQDLETWESARNVWMEAVEETSGKAVEQKAADTGEVRHSRLIKQGMSEEERYNILKNDSITIPDYDKSKMPESMEKLQILESNAYKGARAIITEMARDNGILRDGYRTQDLDFEFRFGSNNYGESIHRQSNIPVPDRYLAFAKMLTCFDDVIENARLIESHPDRYDGGERGDKELRGVHVLVSAFKDGETIRPVKLEIKEFQTGRANKKSGLYVAITMPDIKTDSSEVGLTRNGSSRNLPSVFTYNLADLLREIKKNPAAGPLAKYVPAQFAEEGNEDDLGPVKKQFDMSEPVEQTKNLIAMHNLNETKLNSLLEYEGIPMPSIAITKVDIGHENFGGISFVFRKDTIDPKNRKNKVYSADAWTPTFPRIEYQANEKAETRIREKFYSLQEKYGRDVADPLYSYGNLLEDSMNRYNGAAGILEKEIEKPMMVKAYLYDIGRGEEIPGVETMEKETRTPMSEQTIELGNYIIDSIGREAFENKTVKLRDIREAFRQRLIQVVGMSEEEANDAAKKHGSLFYEKIGKIVKSVFNGQTETVTKTTTRDSSNQDAFLKAEMGKEGYKKWLRDLFDDVEKGKGIYNGKDFYTNSGSRRSFKATHYDVTAANIVKAMLAQNEGRSQNAGGFIAGVKSLRSSAAESFRSIKDIKKASAVLKNTDSETYQKMLDELSTRLYDSISEIKKDKRDFFETDNIGSTLIEAIEGHKTTVDGLKSIFKKYGYALTDEQAQTFSDLIEDVRNMPVNMFEAKPERVVGWDEVAAAVMPDTTSAETLSALKAHGVNNIHLYEEGNEAERKKIISEMKDVRFQKDVDEDAGDTRRVFISYNPDLQKAVRELTSVLTAYKALAPTQEEIKRNTRQIVKKFGSSINVDRAASKIESLYSFLAEGGKPDGQEVMDAAMDIANDILDEATHSDPEVEKRWKDFKKEMRKRRIYIPKDRVADLNPDGLKALRKQWHGKMLFTTDEKYRERYGNIHYQELQSLFPDYFTKPSEDLANDMDAIQEIMNAFELQAPAYEKVYTGATRDEAALELSYDIMQGYFGNDRAAERFRKIYRDYVKPIKDRALEDYRQKLREIQIKDAAALEQRTVFDRVRGLGNAYIVSETALKEANIQGRRALMERIQEKSEQEKAHYREQLEKAKAGYIDREQKERLLRLARQLEKMKGGAEFEQKKKELIGDLDLVARGLSSGLELRLEDQRREYEYLQETDPTFEPDRATLKAFERLDKRQINSLKSYEVRELIQAILKAREDQWNHNRLIREDDAMLVAEMGGMIISQTRAQKGTRTGSIGDKIDSYSLAHLNSKRAFRKMSGYNEKSGLMSLWNELNEGQHKEMDFRRRSEGMFEGFLKDSKNKDFIKGMFTPSVEVTSSYMGIKDGSGRLVKIVKPETVKITPAMRISMYLHSLNQDNREHISRGGIRIPNMDLYAKGKYAEAYGQGAKVLHFNKADLKKVVDTMTPQEREFADIAWKFFNETSKEAINETSMLLDGYGKAIVDNYMPIKTDTNFTKKDMSGLVQDGTIESMGSLKERNIHAKNPILLEDITQVLERSIRNTGLYYGLAIPVRNFNKVYNFQYGGYTDSVKESIQQVFGKKGNQYIEKLLRDIQGGNSTTKDNAGELVDRFTSGLRGNYAGAVLTLNPSVAMKQAASYPTAAARLGFGPLAKAFTRFATKTSEDMELINKYTPLLWNRTIGQSSDALAEVSKRKSPWRYNGGMEKTRQALNWIQNIDVKTVKTLWYASEYYVQENVKDLNPGTEEYYREVARVFNEVVEDTQPNYTVMQRASISRADNEIMKAVFMFKTQPLQNLGILYDSIMNYSAKKEAYKQIRPELPPAAKENAYREMAAARQGMMRSVASIVVSTAVFSAMTTAAALLLHRMDPFRDPETGEITKKSLLTKYFQNCAESLSGMMLGAGEIYSLIMAATTGSYLDDFSVSGIDSLNDTVSKILNLYQVVGKSMEDDEKSTAEKAETIGKAAGNLALKLSELTGIPASNLKKIAQSMMNYYSDIVDGTLQNFESGSKLTKVQYANRAISAYKEGKLEKGDAALEETNKASLEKALGKKLTKDLYEAFQEDGSLFEAYLNLDDTRKLKLSDVPDNGFNSFTKLREAIGDPDYSHNWHHIVEQEQGPGEKNFGTFPSTKINNTNNIVSVPSGALSPHTEISKYYDSVQDFTGGKKVREWLRDKSFEEQFEFGVEQLRKYGDLLPTDNGWIFVPDTEKFKAMKPRKQGTITEKTETQRKFDSAIEEKKEDGSLTDKEIREVTISMIRDGLSTEEALELYRSRKKNDKHLDTWMEKHDDVEPYFDVLDAKADGNQDGVWKYLRSSGMPESEQKEIWLMLDYAESSWEKRKKGK